MTDLSARAVRLYAKGMTMREVGAQLGVDPTTVAHRLRDAGVEPRKRGQRPHADKIVQQIVELRQARQMSWQQIADETGVAKTACRAIFLRATGERGHLDQPHMTDRQRARLQQMLADVPQSPNGRGLATRESMEGRKLAEQVRRHVAAGITASECARALGRTPAWIGYILAD